jgi:hypothetical protein
MPGAVTNFFVNSDAKKTTESKKVELTVIANDSKAPSIGQYFAFSRLNTIAARRQSPVQQPQDNVVS